MKRLALLFLSMSVLLGCGQVNTGKAQEDKIATSQEEVVYENTNYTKYIEVSDIKRDVTLLDKKYKKYFDKFIQYKAPNGKYINIIAQDKVSDEQLLKAYNVLSFYLTSYKYEMSDVANKLADNHAILMMPNGADGDVRLKESIFIGQPLYQMETPVTGDSWYIKNNYEHRDASYEEIFHLVHDYGIGTSSNPGALNEVTATIKSAMNNALPKEKDLWGKSGLWGYDSKEWLNELSAEGSLEQEYIVSVIDSYYGLWEAFDGDKGMWGIYIAKNRDAVKNQDPKGYEALTSFLPQNFTYMDRISPDFNGTFSMSLTDEPYTKKSQYLLNARLTGSADSNLTGNERNNILIGNSGNNIIDGKKGVDVVQFTGMSSEYEINGNQIKDLKNRDGLDTLKNIEIIRFTDKDVQFE